MPTLNLAVTADENDVQCWSDGTNFSTGGNYNPARASGTVGGIFRNAGLRFLNATITQGATINTAVPKVYPHSTTTDDADLHIYGVDEDDAAVWNGTTRRPYSGDLPFTTANVAWDATTLGTAQVAAPDVSTIVQELVDRAGWAGGALALIFQGDDTGTDRELGITNYGGTPAEAATLDIDYTEPPPAGRVVPMTMNVSQVGITRTVPMALNVSQAEIDRVVPMAMNVSQAENPRTVPMAMNVSVTGIERTVPMALNVSRQFEHTVPMLMNVANPTVVGAYVHPGSARVRK